MQSCDSTGLLSLSGNRLFKVKVTPTVLVNALVTWMNIFTVTCIYVHMSAVSHRGSSFVYLFLACSWSFLCRLVCVCVRSMCVRERILVWAFTFLWCFLSRCQIAKYLFSRSLRMFCQPWPTYLFLRYCPLAGFTFRVSTKETVSIKPENDFPEMCYQNTLNRVCLGVSSLLRWWLFSKGNCIPARDWRAETVSLREGKICTAATPCSVYTICVTDELWMML